MPNISIFMKDNAYASALAEALSRARESFRISIAASAEEASDADLVLCRGEDAGLFGDKAFEVSYMPVSALAARLQAAAPEGPGRPRAGGLPAPPPECVFVVITAGRGGSGASSAARAAGRIFSRIYGLKSLYISFEPFIRSGSSSHASEIFIHRALSDRADEDSLKSALETDIFGLSAFIIPSGRNPFCLDDFDQVYRVLLCAATLDCFDRVLLDVPCGMPMLHDIMSLCEHRVFVSGYTDKTDAAEDPVYSELKDRAGQTESSGGALHILRLSCDEDSFLGDTVDIHGQFGAEVRGLAQEIEGK